MNVKAAWEPEHHRVFVELAKDIGASSTAE